MLHMFSTVVDLRQMLLPDIPPPQPISLGQSVTFHLVQDAFELSREQWSLETVHPPLPPVTTSRHVSDPGLLPSAPWHSQDFLFGQQRF